MTEVLQRRPSANGRGTPHPVRRRRPLPSGRAVVGAFLIVVAIALTFAAYTRSIAPPTTRYAVAVRDLAPGQEITPDAIDLVAIALPDGQRQRSFDAAEPLHGLVVVEPLLAGELIQEGSVAATGTAGQRTVSFAVPRARAVDGSLQAGERVDLLVTFGSGSESCTQLVAGDVAVTAVGAAPTSVVTSDDITLTVGVEDAETELAVAHAATAGTITVARTTGADPATTTAPVCTPAGSSQTSPTDTTAG